jgi:hypothetical protein
MNSHNEAPVFNEKDGPSPMQDEGFLSKNNTD